jgi:hypothetical protein
MYAGSRAWTDESAPTTRVAIGVGVLTAAAVLGGLVWLVRRQVTEKDILQVRMIHSADPALDARLADISTKLDEVNTNLIKWLPIGQKIADKGVLLPGTGRLLSKNE